MILWPDIGTRSGRLTAIAPIPGTQRSRRKWLWQCDCGKQRVAYVSHVRSGLTTSCGCARGKHRLTGRGSYKAWTSMIQRCTNPKNPAFKNYGGRGITVCDRWRGNYTAFLVDMGPRPSLAHTVERKDNAGNYEPDNCGWATRAEQLRNTRRNVLVTFEGKEMCLKDAARAAGIDYKAIEARYRRGKRGADLFVAPTYSRTKGGPRD